MTLDSKHRGPDVEMGTLAREGSAAGVEIADLAVVLDSSPLAWLIDHLVLDPGEVLDPRVVVDLCDGLASCGEGLLAKEVALCREFAPTDVEIREVASETAQFLVSANRWIAEARTRQLRVWRKT